MDQTSAVKLVLVSIIFCVPAFAQDRSRCQIPQVLQNSWFSRENGNNTLTEINAESMSNRGTCIDSAEKKRLHYTFLFHHENRCYYCVKFIVRTINVLQKFESNCFTIPEGAERTVKKWCSHVVRTDQESIALFSENYIPVNCRSSLEGVWQFAYKNRFTSTGECDHPRALIHSCQNPGTQFLITNEKFNITYKRCTNMRETYDAEVEYSCLGSWFENKNQFFVVANTKESRKEEKYRCFLRNRDDDQFLGVSITAECNTLPSVDESPVRFRITPVEPEVVRPGCSLPRNMSGEWINTAYHEADVVINDTHIVETWHPDADRTRRTIYVCQKRHGSRIMMARLTVDGCQKDYVCFDFIPRHHNVIRYRRGRAFIKKDLSTVCSWIQFPNKADWKYDLLLAKNPTPVRCPVAGKFRFEQKGEIPFETKILGGVTLSPRHNSNCTYEISDFSSCDAEQKEITIDEKYCLTVDHLGRHTDIYSDPDYKMKCIGFWKENLKSYLITFNELDEFSEYRCWVYQRADQNKVLMSQSIGPYCWLQQDVDSYNGTHGAAVALEMIEYERERDQCPMHFDDGANPWLDSTSSFTVFHFPH